MAKKGGKKGKEQPVEVQSDESDWDDGAKKSSKKQLEKEAKRQKDLDKKKEREDALKMEEEVNSASSKKGGKGGKKGKKGGPSSGLDDALNAFGPKSSISADGIDDSLAALTLLNKDAVGDKDIDRHPERRFKAALAAYSERRLPELKKEHTGLRKQQLEQLIYKEFQKSDENPLNKDTNASYNSNAEEVSNLKKSVKDKRSKRFER